MSDQQASIRRQVLQRIADRRASENARGAPPWQVQRQDLGSLEAVQALLSALNDPYVATQQVGGLVEDIRVLRARCIRRAVQASEMEQVPTLAEALALIGNKGLEAELLSVLEDLTILSADSEPELE